MILNISNNYFISQGKNELGLVVSYSLYDIII